MSEPMQQAIAVREAQRLIESWTGTAHLVGGFAPGAAEAYRRAGAELQADGRRSSKPPARLVAGGGLMLVSIGGCRYRVSLAPVERPECVSLVTPMHAIC